jgi:hypothetical protein
MRIEFSFLAGAEYGGDWAIPFDGRNGVGPRGSRPCAPVKTVVASERVAVEFLAKLPVPAWLDSTVAAAQDMGLTRHKLGLIQAEMGLPKLWS